MNDSHHGRRWAGTAVAALLLAATIAAPASAKQDAGGPLVEYTQQQVSPQCLLRRIEQQLVRCDSLTGGGVPAASWVPEL